MSPDVCQRWTRPPRKTTSSRVFFLNGTWCGMREQPISQPLDCSWGNAAAFSVNKTFHKWQLTSALSLGTTRAEETDSNTWESTASVAERDMPLQIFTRNADKIPWSASSFSSSLSSSCKTPKMYAPYTSRSTSNESRRSFSQLSNSPASVTGAAILALWGLSVARGCPMSLPVQKDWGRT